MCGGGGSKPSSGAVLSAMGSATRGDAAPLHTMFGTQPPGQTQQQSGAMPVAKYGSELGQNGSGNDIVGNLASRPSQTTGG